MVKSLGRVGFWCKQFRGIFVVWLSTAALAMNQQLDRFHLLIISTHSREKSQPLSKCWKVSTKKQNLNASVYVRTSMSICLWPPACFGWPTFIASLQTCVWHLHARMTEPPAVMNIPWVTCHVLKPIYQLLSRFQPIGPSATFQSAPYATGRTDYDKICGEWCFSVTNC